MPTLGCWIGIYPALRIVARRGGRGASSDRGHERVRRRHLCLGLIDSGLLGSTEGYRESKRFSKDTYPESCIIKNLIIRRLGIRERAALWSKPSLVQYFPRLYLQNLWAGFSSPSGGGWGRSRAGPTQDCDPRQATMKRELMAPRTDRTTPVCEREPHF